VAIEGLDRRSGQVHTIKRLMLKNNSDITLLSSPPLYLQHNTINTDGICTASLSLNRYCLHLCVTKVHSRAMVGIESKDAMLLDIDESTGFIKK
jgi:hypothetical protein